MPDIEITDTQQADFTSIREELEDAFIQTYGHMRVQDVIDYLLDTYTPPDQLEDENNLSHADYERIASAEYPQLQQVASEVSEVPGSGIDADEMRGKLLSALGTTELATRLADIEPDVEENESGKEMAAGPTETTDTPDDERDVEQNDTSTETGPSSNTVETSTETEPDETADDTPNNMLSVANRLLTEHSEKWTKSDGDDEPYEVTLPDGSMVSARTKDDVRKLLFQNY